MKITPGHIQSDGHVVLLPAGVVGEVVTADGTVYNLGSAQQVAIEVESHDHAKEVALEVSRRVHADESFSDIEHDESLSLKNLGIKKGH